MNLKSVLYLFFLIFLISEVIALDCSDWEYLTINCGAVTTDLRYCSYSNSICRQVAPYENPYQCRNCPVGYTKTGCAVEPGTSSCWTLVGDMEQAITPIVKPICRRYTTNSCNAYCGGSTYYTPYCSSYNCLYTSESCSFGCSESGCCECANTSCNPLFNGQSCNGCSYVAAPEETCNLIDDDCDNIEDEGDICGFEPLHLEFDGSDTTSFASLYNFKNVINLTLEGNNAKIKWHNLVLVDNADFDSKVEFGYGFVTVNSSGLDESINNSAEITLTGIDCSSERFIYSSETGNTREEILSEGNICTDCTGISCSDNTLIFNVSHFSGFAAGLNANLTTTDTSPKATEIIVTFDAYYINSTSGNLIQDASCNISFSNEVGTWHPMEELTNFYEFNYTFSSAGGYTYTVNCTHPDFSQLNASDAFNINPISAVPEFSELTIIIALIVVITGLFVIKQN